MLQLDWLAVCNSFGLVWSREFVRYHIVFSCFRILVVWFSLVGGFLILLLYFFFLLIFLCRFLSKKQKKKTFMRRTCDILFQLKKKEEKIETCILVILSALG